MFSEVPPIDEKDLLGSTKRIYEYLNTLKQELEYTLNNLGSENINEIDGKIVKVTNVK